MFRLSDALAGYALFRVDRDSVHLRHFFVGRASRRHGVGHAAFAALADRWFPAGHEVHISVRDSNMAGQAFWARIGFSRYGVVMCRSGGGPA